jgi:hypothetical protein
MTGLLIGVALLASPAAPAPTPGPLHAAIAPGVFSVEFQNSAPRDLRRQPSVVRSPAAARTRHSRMDRIIAVAAGVSIGWVVGGGIGYAVTPKRGPYDDTSGLKGMIIGAPIGAVAGALLGYRLTK